jgi:LuxR family maltose regulon positive regulatory protein
VIPLDGQRRWYRYHALFAEAMRDEARRRFGEAGLRTLYARASRWYAQHGQLSNAVEAALTAREYAAAAALIERAIEARGRAHELHTLRRWVEQLPEDARDRHPAVCFAYAAALLFTEDRRAPATAALLQPPLLAAEQGWRAAGDRHRLGALLTFRAMVAWWQGDTARSFADARQALALLPGQDVEWRGPCLLHVGMEALLEGHADAAYALILEARALCEAAVNIHATLASSFLLGDICRRQGRLRQAGQLYQAVLDEAEKVELGEPLDDRAGALLGLAALAYEHNQLAAAEAAVAEALMISKRLQADELLIPATLLLARVLLARGDTDQARQQLDQLVGALQPRRAWQRREALAAQARLALARGDLAVVERWASAHARCLDEVPLLQQEQEALIVARLSIARGQAAAALPTLAGWLADARANGRIGSVIEILIVTALAHFVDDDLPAAGRALGEALGLAEPEGYRRLFLDEGPALADLLLVLRQQTAGPAPYLDALLAAFASAEERGLRAAYLDPGSPLPSSRSLGLVEPLSPREQRVLRLLAAGLSNPEIAQELVVSVNTVKTHVQSIYRKLNVTSRSQARQAAHNLSLIP